MVVGGGGGDEGVGQSLSQRGTEQGNFKNSIGVPVCRTKTRPEAGGQRSPQRSFCPHPPHRPQSKVN